MENSDVIETKTIFNDFNDADYISVSYDDEHRVNIFFSSILLTWDS